MTTPALTAEAEALLVRMERAGWTFGLRDELADRLAAIEAAAVARHVRETGCEGLREALSLLVEETTYWSYMWSDGRGRSWKFGEMQDSHLRAVHAAQEVLGTTDSKRFAIVDRAYHERLQRAALASPATEEVERG